MRQAGVSDYVRFATEALEIIDGLPLSLEVFSDEFPEMLRQARILSGLGNNVNVKIPITNTRGESSLGVVRELTKSGVPTNVTAIFTLKQVSDTVSALEGGPESYVSVFAGRIADAGIDPLPVMDAAVKTLKSQPQLKLIWASPREVLNIVQASSVGCHVITVTHDLLKKLPSLGKNLEEFSLETVKMFASDAQSAGYVL